MKGIRCLVVLTAVLAALGVTESASAKCRKSPLGNPAAREYREHIPTVCGPRPSGKGGPSGRLPASISQKLGSGPEADLLRMVATSPKLGAPATSVRRTKGIRREQGQRNPLSAAGTVVTDGGDGRLILLLALLGSSAVVIGAIAYRRRLVR